MSTRSTFGPISRRSLVARVLLAVTVAVDVAAVANVAVTSVLLNHLTSGDTATADAIGASARRDVFIGFAQLALYVATGIAFVLWLHRAYRNLDALGLRRRHRSAWTIIAWFVPVGGFVILRRMMHDLCAPAGSVRRASAWLALLIGSDVAVILAIRMASQQPTIHSVRNVFVMLCLSDFLAVPAAVLAFTLVRSVSRAQESTRLAPAA